MYCNLATGCLLPVGVFNPVYVVFELFVSKYLSGVSVNWLDKLSALSATNKLLNLYTSYVYMYVTQPLCVNMKSFSVIRQNETSLGTCSFSLDV